MGHTPEGTVVTVFRSRLRPDHADEYATTAAEVLALARTMPGFVSYDHFEAADGERLALVVFDTPEHQQQWRDQERHREAQQAGRDRFYTEYSIAVCDCRSSWSWVSPAG